MRGGDHPGILASFRLAELTPDEIRDATTKLITEMRGKYDEVRCKMNEGTNFESRGGIFSYTLFL